ncbi:PIG-L deacetylase family protein [Pseudomonas putida]|uniref:Acetylglucosaminylphosphatidylinositol deacetylase n=1 Tax=Pseudomonas putida TaxID=303 RepID=A0A177SG84_PSEPU|nr:PIG-L family deacetylase [Pseudomonas putida]OAI88321.1 acetylglucosaminylphosphatidylinositol deacetylase [Pseudomonas putida]
MSEDLFRGPATTPAQWQQSAHLARATWITPEQLCPPGRRLIVVAPHPDDEILACGGLLASLRGREQDLLLISATDGEASHPGSQQWTEHRLRRQRPQESRNALHRLGLDLQALDWQRLSLKDTAVARDEAYLVGHLGQLLRPDDLLLCTWRGDGHCDHEAVGRACAQAAQAKGATLLEVPVWAWYWAQPEDPRLPWERACKVQLDADAVQRKQQAIAAHVSQIESDGERPPVLPAETLECLMQPFELVFR